MSKNNFLHLFIKSYFLFYFQKIYKTTNRTKKENKENRKVLITRKNNNKKMTKSEIDENFPTPAEKRPKLLGMDFYTKVLGAPKFVVICLIYFYYTFMKF